MSAATIPHLDLTAPRSGRKDLAALAGYWRRLRRRCGCAGLYSPGRVLSRLLAGLHVLAGCGARFHGDSHDSPSDRRRLGHGDPPHPGRGHANPAAAGGPVHSHNHRGFSAPALSSGRMPLGQHRGSAHSRASGEAQLRYRTYLTFQGFSSAPYFYFVVWNVLSFLLSMWSKQTDHAGCT